MLRFLRQHSLAIIFFILLTSLSLFSLFKSGVPQTHDGIFHSIRAVKMFQELKSGQFPVRWVFSLDNRYGVPLFNYVYPAPYYFSAIFMALGISNVTALKLLILLSYLLAGLGVYLLALSFNLSKLHSVLVSLVYLFLPYHFVNIFVRGSIGETIVLGLAPWVLLCIKQLRSNKIRWFTPIPLALAMLSHNFLGLFLAGVLVVYSLFQHHRLKLLLSILISFSLSAFFLLPMILESSYLLSATQAKFSFNWQEHFIYPKQLFYSPWGYGFSRPGIADDGMTFQLGFGAIAIIVTSLISMKISLWLLLDLFVIYLMTPFSHWFWSLFPFLAVIQFPWRLLGLSSILIIFHLVWLVAKFNSARLKTLFLGSLAILSIFNTWQFHQPKRFYLPEEFMREYDNYQGLTTTSYRSEIIPRWAKEERYEPHGSDIVYRFLGVNGPAKIQLIQFQPNKLDFIAKAENSSARAIYYHNYFPNWYGRIDNQPLTLEPTSTGEILIPLQQGEHHYSIYYRQTNLEIISNLISLSALIYLVILAIKYD